MLGLSTIFWGTLYLLFFPIDRGGFFYYQCSRFWAKGIVKMSGVRVDVTGLEKIPMEPSVFMANHQSYFDVLCLIAYLPRPVRFVAKHILKYIPILGQWMWLTGHIIIERENPKQAFSALDKAAEKIRKGTSVLVFPEGTRSPDHKLGDFKKGGFVLALKAGVPIVPVSITGTQSMMPKGKYSFTRSKGVRIKIGEPIPTQDFSLEKKQELMQKVKTAMIAGFDPDSEEAKANQN